MTAFEVGLYITTVLALLLAMIIAYDRDRSGR